GIPVIDATDVVTVVHQNHDYGHLAGGKRTVEVGAEASRNLELGGGYRHLFTIQDADWRMTPRGIVRNWCRSDSERYGEVYEILREGRSGWRVRLGRLMAELLCEWVARWRQYRQGHVAPLLKFPAWCIRRVNRE
ncbi:MAG: hypothetical protein WCO77_12150, partial [bacterium]